eukprot:PhM_4_TR706/c0_g1_i1/m.105189
MLRGGGVRRDDNFELLHNNKTRNGVHSAAEVIGQVPPVEGPDAVLAQRHAEPVHHAAVFELSFGVRALRVDEALYAFDWHRHEGVEHAGDHRGRDERRRRGVLKTNNVHEHRFALVVETNLRDTDGDGAEHRRSGAAPKRKRSLLPHNLRKGVRHAVVAPALRDRCLCLGLEAHKHKVRGTAHKGCDATARGASDNADPQRRRTPTGDHVPEGAVEPKPRRGVEALPHDAGREPGVEPEDAPRGDDAPHSLQHGLPGELHPHFDNVHRMHNDPGNDTADGADGELRPIDPIDLLVRFCFQRK